MFDCEVELYIVLSKKMGHDFASNVRIKLAGDEHSGGEWRQMGVPDSRLPSNGEWTALPNGVLLKRGHQRTGDSSLFALLRTMGVPAQINAIGDINLFEPGQRTYSSSNIKWSGGGKFTVLADHANLPLPPFPGTWTTMKRNIWDTVGQGLDWEITGTGWGVTLAGGAGGKGGEFTTGNLNVRLAVPPHTERTFRFTAAGVGFMLKGFSASGSAPFTPSKGTTITKGNMPISQPFRITDLEGPCQIVDLGIGGISKKYMGAGYGWMGFVFGVPGWLAVGAHKAVGWTYGPMPMVGTSGASAGATLLIGNLSLT